MRESPPRTRRTRTGRRLALAALIVTVAVLLPPAPGASAATQSFPAQADARVSESNPTNNYGSATALRVDAGTDPDVESYLRFTVAGVDGAVLSAKLRVFASSGTANGPAAYATANTWTESGLTWNNRTARTGGANDDKGTIASGTWVEWNVTPLVTGNGTYNFVLAGTSTDGVDFHSREGSSKPSLVLDVSPVADTGPPSDPTGLSATATGPGSVDLSWNPSLDDRGIAGYDVYRNAAFLAGTTGTGTTYTDASAQPNTTYTYYVVARDTAGKLSGPSNTDEATTPDGPLPPVTQTFIADADARVQESSPGSNYATSGLRVDAGTGARVESYLRFPVANLSGVVQSAVLRVFSSSGTVDGPSVYGTSAGWSETGITWNNHPARTSGAVDDRAAVASGAWTQWDVTSLLSANGPFALVLAGVSTDGVDFNSREGQNKPQLVVTTGTPVPDLEDPSAPTNVDATAPSATRVDLSWTASDDDVGVTGYDVYRDGAFLKSVGAQTTTTDLTVVASTPYSYRVVAKDASGKESDPSDEALVTTPAASIDPVIAAAGDIACATDNSKYNGGLGTATACRQKATSDLLVAGNYDAVLAMGDNQYTDGALAQFQASYDPTWGRVKSITHPVPGNHEYVFAGAPGYFAYFGPAAGDPTKGYYSFDLGTWHVVAINSNCGKIAGGCGAGGLQETWLRDDLATHPATCTLAFWHHPRWSSGGGGDTNSMGPIWTALYQGGADLVLAGHSHSYERFAPMNATGGLDQTGGVREFVVGTGGVGFTSSVTPRQNSQLFNNTTFGVLQLALHPTSYDYEFVPEAGKTFTDSGTGECH